MLLSLQYLRGLAALMIVYLHAIEPVATITGAKVPESISSLGIDLFFVISGVVMWLSTHERKLKPHQFMINRLVRIAPLYWALTLLVAGLAFAAPTLFRSTKFELDHVVASLAFMPWPNPASSQLTPVIVPGWTLNYEMFFYLVFALTLPLKPMLRIGGVVIVLGSLALAGSLQRETEIIGFYTNPILIEFALGVVLGALYTSKLVVPKAAALASCAGALILSVLAFEHMSVSGVLIVAVPSAMLIGGLIFFEKQASIPDIKALRRGGDVSYALYLSHPIALAAQASLLAKSGLGAHLPWPVVLVILVCGSLCVGDAVHAFLEKPLTDAARASTHRRRVRSAAHEALASTLTREKAGLT